LAGESRKSLPPFGTNLAAPWVLGPMPEDDPVGAVPTVTLQQRWN
jgi:hypothetical protein